MLRFSQIEGKALHQQEDRDSIAILPLLQWHDKWPKKSLRRDSWAALLYAQMWNPLPEHLHFPSHFSHWPAPPACPPAVRMSGSCSVEAAQEIECEWTGNL